MLSLLSAAHHHLGLLANASAASLAFALSQPRLRDPTHLSVYVSGGDDPYLFKRRESAFDLIHDLNLRIVNPDGARVDTMLRAMLLHLCKHLHLGSYAES